jgi:hypothetical protein
MVKNEFVETLKEWASQPTIKEALGDGIGINVVGDKVIEVTLTDGGETSVIGRATEETPDTFRVTSDEYKNIVNAITGRLKRAGAKVLANDEASAPTKNLVSEKEKAARAERSEISKKADERVAEQAKQMVEKGDQELVEAGKKVDEAAAKKRGRPAKVAKPETAQPAPETTNVTTTPTSTDTGSVSGTLSVPAPTVSPEPTKTAPEVQEVPKAAPKVEKTEPVKSKVLESFKPKAETSKEMVLRPAKREIARARVGFAGASGSGKTASALLFAYGLCADWSRIAIIDTEHGSGDLYVGETIPKNGGVTIGEYSVVPIEAPYLPEKYVAAMKMIEDAKSSDGKHLYDVIIIDSLSHGWVGDGGLLDLQGKEADRLGNSWAAWRKITPMHSKLIEAILKSPLHVILTARSKQAHIQEKNSDGKSIVKRIGMETQFRDGIEYELTTFFDLSQDHTAFCSKDRSNVFDGSYGVITPEHGQKLGLWLNKKA